jgi:hypothetical protein
VRIPKKIKVGSKWYSVNKFKHMHAKGAMGGTWYKDAVIEIATHSNLSNVRFKREEIYNTFWHELTHAILKDMGSKLEANEEFVEAFADRLTDAILSAKFK